MAPKQTTDRFIQDHTRNSDVLLLSTIHRLILVTLNQSWHSPDWVVILCIDAPPFMHLTGPLNQQADSNRTTEV
jgi:hypothetical protein